MTWLVNTVSILHVLCSECYDCTWLGLVVFSCSKMASFSTAYSSSFIAPASNNECSSFSCWMYFPRKSATLYGDDDDVLGAWGFGEVFCEDLENAVTNDVATSVSACVRGDCATLLCLARSAVKIGAQGASSKDLWVPTSSISAQSLYWVRVYLSWCLIVFQLLYVFFNPWIFFL